MCSVLARDKMALSCCAGHESHASLLYGLCPRGGGGGQVWKAGLKTGQGWRQVVVEEEMPEPL